MFKRPRGVTLMDITMGVLVFAIGILAVVGTIPYILKSQRVTQSYTTALGLAEKFMGQIKSQATSASSYDALNTTYNDSASTRNPISGYPGFYSCIQVVNNPSADLKKVTVNIYWSVSGTEKSVNMVNLVRRNY